MLLDDDDDERAAKKRGIQQHTRQINELSHENRCLDTGFDVVPLSETTTSTVVKKARNSNVPL
jgi:hypothetical protein